MIAQGFVKKMVQWFEKARKMWAKEWSSRNEATIKLAEGFFNILMMTGLSQTPNQ